MDMPDTKPMVPPESDDELEDDFELPENIPPLSTAIEIVYLVVLVAGYAWCHFADRHLIRIEDYTSFTLEVLGAVAVGAILVTITGAIWKRSELFRAIELAFADRLGGLSWSGVLRLAILSSVAEEIFFRGVLYTHLRDATAGSGRAVSVL